MEKYEKLSDRKKVILFNAIEDYIKDANPITSQNVHERHLKDISTATLRNELSALEAMGYLRQFHTSSGREPTTKAYRYYVNELMKNAKFTADTLSKVNATIFKRTDNLSEIVSSIAKVISEVTNYPSVVVLNGLDKLIIKNIKIIPLIDGSGLVLIATETGIINNNIGLPEGVTEENCNDAGKFLTTRFNGKTIGDMIMNIEKYQDSFEDEIMQFKSIFTSLVDCIDKINNTQIFQKGTTKLLNSPVMEDVNEAKKIIEFLEQDDNVKSLLADDTDEEITFSIGDENEHEELENCSVIKANYKYKGENIASIGVIGPERMDYMKIAASIKLILDEINIINSIEQKENK